MRIEVGATLLAVAFLVAAQNADAYLQEGIKLANQGQHTKAVQSFTKAIELNTSFGEAFRRRGIAKRSLGDNRGALEDFDQAVRIDPNDSRAFYGRAYTRQNLGDYQGALTDATRAIELDPNYSNAYVNRALTRKELGDLPGAMKDIQQAIEKDPRNKFAYLNRGWLKRQQGDLRGALADYDQALALDPSFAGAYVDRAGVRDRLGDYDGAIADSTRALAIAPRDADAYVNRGLGYQHKRDLSKALADAEKALEIDPRHEKAERLRSEIRRELSPAGAAAGQMPPSRPAAPPVSAASPTPSAVVTLPGEPSAVVATAAPTQEDAAFDAADALKALKMSIRLIPESSVLDVDKDGRLTSTDARLLLRRVTERPSPGTAGGRTSRKPVEPSKSDAAWIRTFGGPGIDVGRSFDQTHDGGFLAAGYTHREANEPPLLWVVRLDPQGVKIWEETFGRAVHGSQRYSICSTADGGCVVMGPTTQQSERGDFEEARIIRLDGTGKVRWERTVAAWGQRYISAGGHFLLESSEGGFLVTGSGANPGGAQTGCLSAAWLVKLDAQGNRIWDRVLGGQAEVEKATAVVETPDRHIVVAQTGCGRGGGLEVLKLGPEGQPIWKRHYTSAISSQARDIVKSVGLTPDGGFIIAGGTGESSFSQFVLSLDSRGQWQWDKTFSQCLACGPSRTTRDGGCILSCRWDDYQEGRVDVVVLKLAPDGTVVWTRRIGERRRNSAYESNGTLETPDGCPVLGGWKSITNTDSDLCLIKLDGNGRINQRGLVTADNIPITIEENTFRPR